MSLSQEAFFTVTTLGTESPLEDLMQQLGLTSLRSHALPSYHKALEFCPQHSGDFGDGTVFGD